MRWGTERQTIKALEARLQWFMNEADPDEFDSEEITAIVDLLQIMDPIERREGDFYVADKGLGRFWAFYVFRKMYQRPEKDEPAYPLGLRIEMRLRHIFRSNVVVNGAFIVALVVAMILGGTTVVFAQREGFFHKLNVGGHKDTVITSSTGIEFERDKYVTYENIEYVPVNYVKYVWAPIMIPSELELQVTELVDNQFYIRIKCNFINQEAKKYVYASKKTYKESIVENDQLYDGFSHYCNKTYNAIEVKYLVKENQDYTEYIALFEHESSSYSLCGNIDFKIIEKIVEENIAIDNF